MTSAISDQELSTEDQTGFGDPGKSARAG